MAQFKIEVAGQTAAVTSLFESTRDYCDRYYSQKEPDFFISTTQEDLAFEQEDSIREAREEGFRIRYFPEPFLERASIQRKFAEHLFGLNTLLFHGSTVAVDNRAYLFTAKSGTGKSTHTRLWREVFGECAVMVNDDKPFLRIEETQVLAFGSPWSGKHGLDTNICVPLKGICLLERGKENTIRKAQPEELMPMLLHESYHPLNPGKLPQLEALVTALAEHTPLWHMTCNKDSQAAAVAYEAMSRN